MVNIILFVLMLVVSLGLQKGLKDHREGVSPVAQGWRWLLSRYRLELLIIVNAAIGCLWGRDYPALIAVVILMPVVWSCANSRFEAFWITVVYYLAGSRDLPQGTGIFFDGGMALALGYVLWFFAAAANAVVWSICWQTKAAYRAIGAQFALVLTALPPVGIIGWCNPLTASGWLFPMCGLIGILFTMLLVAIIVSRNFSMLQRFGYVVIAGGLIVNFYYTYFLPPNSFPDLQNWKSYDSHFADLKSVSNDMFFSRVQGVTQIADMAEPNQVIILPESILPEHALSEPFSAAIIQSAAEKLASKNALVLIGTESTKEDGSVDNVLMPLGQKGINLKQRVPVPVGMWRPWNKNTFNTDLFGSGVAVVRGIRTAYLICYEQVLTYPVLLSAVRDPKIIIGSSNDWWARNGSIPKIQQASLMSWGRLLGIPTLSATNY